MADTRSGLTACGGCAFWRHMSGVGGTCHRNAPAPGHGSSEVAHWPGTDATDSCGDGAAAATSTVHVTLCRDCRYWHDPTAGRGLSPVDRRDQTKGWWMQAGYCVRHAPGPSREPGYRGFWRATHATDGCAEGRLLAPPDPGSPDVAA
jgi:hypothetical protein